MDARCREAAGRWGEVRLALAESLQANPSCMQICYPQSMQSTSVRIDVATHRELKRLAASLGTSVGDTVALAVRRLRQDQIGADLRNELTTSEVVWLDADLG